MSKIEPKFVPLPDIARNQSNKVEDELNEADIILCNHCLRTQSNGIRCLGICVADSEY